MQRNQCIHWDLLGSSQTSVNVRNLGMLWLRGLMFKPITVFQWRVHTIIETFQQYHLHFGELLHTHIRIYWTIVGLPFQLSKYVATSKSAWTLNTCPWWCLLKSNRKIKEDFFSLKQTQTHHYLIQKERPQLCGHFTISIIRTLTTWPYTHLHTFRFPEPTLQMLNRTSATWHK